MTDSNCLPTRPHQHMTVMKAMDKIRTWQADNPTPTKDKPCAVAIGALPRSGKSYMGASLAHLYSLHLQQQGILPTGRGARVLVYTTQPTETGSTWTAVLNRHAEYDTSHSNMQRRSSSSVIADPAGWSAGGTVRASSASEVHPAVDTVSLRPASWVVMSKQAYDFRTGQDQQAASKRSTYHNLKQQVDPLVDRLDSSVVDGTEPAADEYVADSTEADITCSTNSNSANSSLGRVKIISCDKASRQQWQVDAGRKPTISEVIGQGFDIILFDEAHLGSTSDLSKQAVQQLMAGGHTLLVLITATYMRPVGGYTVPSDRLLCWSLLDVGLARNGSIKALAERHGEKFLQGALQYSGIIAPEQVSNHGRNPTCCQLVCWRATTDARCCLQCCQFAVA